MRSRPMRRSGGHMPWLQMLLSRFGFQQEGFGRQTAGEAGQFAVGTDYPMAGDHDGDGISSVGRSDCAHGFWTSDLLCNVSILASLTVRDGSHGSPLFLLTFGSSELEFV